eukprot:12271177-Ditylum_brightwellii.AAC.1
MPTSSGVVDSMGIIKNIAKMTDLENQTINAGDNGHQNKDINNSQGGKRKNKDNSHNDNDRNTAKEGGKINQNTNKVILTIKTPTVATYDKDE